ncbi:MAG: molybdenum cofactor guanylyltransferase [Verrucomicrobiota bacterium]|nr:molybdenum cofactor guanylyltransferase [Verrucomicrobiota bacterium]
MNFTALLLAGGQSRRMSRDKAGVVIDAIPLWQRQLALLQQLSPGELLISGKQDGPYVEAGVQVVLDDTPNLGPLGGIATALRRAQFRLVLVLAIDLPSMRASFLCELADAALAADRGIVPHDGNWFEPLAAVYPRAALPLADECLRSEDRSMQRFARLAAERGLIRPRLLQEHERALFRNVNAPEDL